METLAAVVVTAATTLTGVWLALRFAAKMCEQIGQTLSTSLLTAISPGEMTKIESPSEIRDTEMTQETMALPWEEWEGGLTVGTDQDFGQTSSLD